MGTGLIGLLFSPGKSIFVYAPLLLLSVALFPAFWRKYRAAAEFILEGLYAHRRIGRTEERGFSAEEKPARREQESRPERPNLRRPLN